jgi:hypothetical protein
MAMVFPTSPTVGQVFTSGGRSWVWNGSAWDAPSAANVLQVPIGLTLVNSTPFTNSTSVIVSNCFSALYDNYLIQLDKVGGGLSTRFQLRTGSTTLASGYSGNVVYGTGSSALSTTRSTSFWESLAGANDATSGYIYYPFLTRAKIWSAISNQGTVPGLDSGAQSSTASYESLVVSFNDSTSGTVRIYGMRNNV